MAAVGDFELLERIGEGGAAQSWRARARDGRDVVVYLVAEPDESERARVAREARAAAAIEHPHLIRVLDHGHASDGAWIATPLVSGMTLRDAVAGRRLSPEAAILLVHPVVDALAALHDAGLVHRALEPESVIVTPLGDVAIIDLGRTIAEGARREGALGYRSPERVEGRDVDATADVWALGVMLYELVAGRRPFERGDASEEASAIAAARFPPLSEADRRVSTELEWIVGVCLARDPWSRPRDARALMERLTPLVPCALDRMRGERVALLSDLASYERRSAERVARAVLAQAEEALASSDTLLALRLIDRVLAYQPDHPAAQVLAQAAASGAVARPGEQAVRRAARPRLPVVAKPEPARTSGVVIALIGLGLAVAAASFIVLASEHAPIVVASRIDRSPPSARDAGEALPAIVPLRVELVPNDLPPSLDGLAARRGEPLLLAPMYGARSASTLLHEAERTLARDPSDADARADRAAALLALDRRDEGLDELAALSRYAPDHPRALALRGLVALREGRFDAADALLSQALEQDPAYVDARLQRGILRHRMGHALDAYGDLVEVIEARPTSTVALAELAQIYARSGQTRDAVPILRRIVRHRPRSADAWVDLAIALGPGDDAIEALDRALALAPDDARALRERCIVLARTNGVGAQPACNRALDRSPEDAELLMARARLASRERRHAEAQADADRAIELAPGVPHLLFERSRVRDRAGDQGGAFRDLSAACAAGHDEACRELRANGIMPP